MTRRRSTLLALTHLHDERVGWVGAFAGTRYVVWEAGQGSVTPPVRRAVLEAIASGVTLVEDGDEVVPGPRAIVTPGQTS